jgi:hypothetical protein
MAVGCPSYDHESGDYKKLLGTDPRSPKKEYDKPRLPPDYKEG